MVSEVGSILMLHRVAPYESGRLQANEDMKISPDELRRVIGVLKSENTEFISLDEVARRLRTGRKSNRKYVAFTLDDGYKDNLKWAYPIFKEEDIPFCIYVTTCFPDRSTNLWWFALEEVILHNKSLTFPEGQTIDNGPPDNKLNNFLLLRQEILDRRFADPLTFLRSAGNLNFDLLRQTEDKCLTWDDIVQLSLDERVTIGAHTVNHFPLSRLTRTESESEITRSRIILEQRIGKPVRHFAFPFGGKTEAGRREYGLARSAGFETAVTTVHGHVREWDNPMCLPRIFLRPLENNRLSLHDIMKRNIFRDLLNFTLRSAIKSRG